MNQSIEQESSKSRPSTQQTKYNPPSKQKDEGHAKRNEKLGKNSKMDAVKQNYQASIGIPGKPGAWFSLSARVTA